MKIKQVIETPEGTYEFQGELNEAEHDLIIEAGVNWLLQQGVIPFKAYKDEKDKIKFEPQEGSGQPS